MSRLVVFGCSNTEGQGLINPKEEVWGALLAPKIDRELVNNGKPGASNKYIAHAINKFHFKPDDLVIIAWSYLNRSCVLRKPSKIKNEIVSKNLSVWLAAQEVEESVSYFKYFYNDYDSEFTNGVFMDFSIDLLLSREIEFKQFFIHPDETPSHRHRSTNTFPFVFKDFYNNFPLAADNDHMGPEGNKVLANAISTIINNCKPII